MKSYEVQIFKKNPDLKGTKYYYYDLKSYDFDDLKKANDFAKKSYYDSDGEDEVVLLEVIKQEISIDGL